jgi:hypothetical protein
MGFFSRFTGKSEERPSTSGPSAADSAATRPGLTAGRRPGAAPGRGVSVPGERDVCIPILGLAPGTRLAQSVHRADGAVLLPAGAELDADQLRRLIQRGVEFVHVMQKETRDAAQIEQDVATATVRVSHLFRGDGSAARKNLGVAIADYRRQAAS